MRRIWLLTTRLNEVLADRDGPDVAVFAERLITPHKFRGVAFFVGNDIVGREGDKTPEEVAGLFAYVLGKVRQHNPTAAVFYVAVTPTPSRWKAWQQSKAANTAGPAWFAIDRRTPTSSVPRASSSTGRATRVPNSSSRTSYTKTAPATSSGPQRSSPTSMQFWTVPSGSYPDGVISTWPMWTKAQVGALRTSAYGSG